jgi:oxepin-CoA hydrolase/3-oxo-5,6-dehydrosuberyl-CoA semialdehyde dehydrogenase
MLTLMNYAQGEWVRGSGKTTDLFHAVTGEKIGEAGSGGLDFKSMAEYARTVGGPALRALTFHQRAAMLKAVARHLTDRKDAFYELSRMTGATKADSWVDIDGGIGTFFAYSSRGRREFPNETFHVEGPSESLSKGGTFVGRHICVPLEGVAIHINAFNFPVWGMMEKLAPALLAGMPCIVKPATATSFLTEAVFRSIIEADILPAGAVQLICGSAGDLLSHVMEQDTVAFTGSAATGQMLKESRAIMEHSVRFNMEADSLNCSILGPDAAPGTEEFDLFIKEVVREMTTKAGQKCTAIRRAFVPVGALEPVRDALVGRLAEVKIGDPSLEGVRMGPLATMEALETARAGLAALEAEAKVAHRGAGPFLARPGFEGKGAFMAPVLLELEPGKAASAVHEIEVFGPVSTLLPYDATAAMIAGVKRGGGGLVASIYSDDRKFVKECVAGIASAHGRIFLGSAKIAGQSPGPGTALPQLQHGGPGRAGGGCELGGERGLLHNMQRVALQGYGPTLDFLLA